MRFHVDLVNNIIQGHQDITPRIADALAKAIGTSAIFWMNLQKEFDLAKLRKL
jgi:addiction module HigA family antidote